MTAAQIIHEIETLPPDEQAVVVRFAYRLDSERKLTGAELSSLAARMVSAKNPSDALMLREEIVRGFYGSKPHA